MSGNQSGGFCHVPCLLSDIFAFICSPGVAPKQRRVVEDGVPAAAASSEMAGSSRKVDEQSCFPRSDNKNLELK